MRTGDVDILLVPGFGNSGPDHWQSRWERNLRTARRIEQASWIAPDEATWSARISAAVASATRPVLLVGHSLGVAAIMHAASRLPKGRVAGAFLVGPADTEAISSWPLPDGLPSWPASILTFAPMPTTQLHFPSRLIASSNDAFCTIDRASTLAMAWGGDLTVIADAGHINAESGHGPWPDGLLTFGMFLRSLN